MIFFKPHSLQRVRFTLAIWCWNTIHRLVCRREKHHWSDSALADFIFYKVAGDQQV